MTRDNARTVVAAAVVFGVSLAITWTARSQRSEPGPQTVRSPVAEWLDLSAPQEKAVAQKDAGFSDDVTRLRTTLDEQQGRLAAMFEEPSTSDETLRTQIETVIDAHNRLERRVADHLLAVREQLTPEQQKRLFGLCAQTVRQQREQQQMRWRHGQRRGDAATIPSEASDDTGGPPYGHRRGHGGGRP